MRIAENVNVARLTVHGKKQPVMFEVFHILFREYITMRFPLTRIALSLGYWAAPRPKPVGRSSSRSPALWDQFDFDR